MSYADLEYHLEDLRNSLQCVPCRCADELDRGVRGLRALACRAILRECPPHTCTMIETVEGAAEAWVGQAQRADAITEARLFTAIWATICDGLTRADVENSRR